MLLTEEELLELMRAAESLEEMRILKNAMEKPVRVSHMTEEEMREVLKWHRRKAGDDPFKDATLGRCSKDCPWVLGCKDALSCKGLEDVKKRRMHNRKKREERKKWMEEKLFQPEQTC